MQDNFDRLRTGKSKIEKEDINWKQIAIGMVIAFGLYLGLKNSFDDTNKRIEDTGKKLDFVLYQNQVYSKNINTLSTTACAECHLSSGMYLPKSSLSMEQFIAYVRGINRFNQNTQMPKFTSEMISDGELEKIWKGLY